MPIEPYTFDSNETAFHCCAEWHLARLKSPTTALVYPFALRIATNSGKFACSAISVSHFLGVHRTTVLRAYQELTTLGFFELLEHGMFDTNIYRVLRHNEWADQHPGLCAVKVEYPWTGEGDPLGQRLYAASGGRVKFKDFQVRAYRATGLEEDTIVELFEDYRSAEGKYRKARNVPYHFLVYLRASTDPKAMPVP